MDDAGGDGGVLWDGVVGLGAGGAELFVDGELNHLPKRFPKKSPSFHFGRSACMAVVYPT